MLYLSKFLRSRVSAELSSSLPSFDKGCSNCDLILNRRFQRNLEPRAGTTIAYLKVWSLLLINYALVGSLLKFLGCEYKLGSGNHFERKDETRLNVQIMVVWSNKSDYFSTFFRENVELVKKCKYLFKYGNTWKMAYVFFALHSITTGIWIVRFFDKCTSIFRSLCCIAFPKCFRKCTVSWNEI